MNLASEILLAKIKRNEEKAKKLLINYFEDSNEVIADLKSVKEKDLDVISSLSEAYLEVALDLSTDYHEQEILFLEAVLLGEDLYSLDEEKGTYLLSKVLFFAPIFKLSNGKEDNNLNRTITKLAFDYNILGRDKFDFIECGAKAVFLTSFKEQQFLKPEKIKEILLELNEFGEEDLPSEYFLALAAQYIKGEIFPYNEKELKRIYKILIERGYSQFTKVLNKMMKDFGRKESIFIS